MGYASCNGFSNPRDMKRVKDRNELWRQVAAEHKSRPLALLLLGGDQVYSDAMWEALPAFRDWAEKSTKKRVKAAFTDVMATQAERYYFWELYCRRWAQQEIQEVFARVPTLMMWDDHDIFDGWGSYPKDLQECPVYQGVFAAARRNFLMFQLQGKEGSLPPSTLPAQPAFSFAHRVGDVGIIALDMRSERTLERVMSEASWMALQAWMATADGLRHLLVMSSIPVVHADFSLLERFLGLFPGQQELEDDLKDHWQSQSHRTERLRFIHRLLGFAETKKCRVTLLSGDVHVGAVGIVSSERSPAADRNSRVINQLTSSGIVHPPPPGMVLYFLESVSNRVEQVDRDITAQMLEFPGTRHRLIGARNWMSLSPDDKGRIWAEWFVAREEKSGPAEKPFTKVIHPCG